MRRVTKRRLFAVFAAAEEDLFADLSGIFHRRKAGAFVRAIAKWLLCRLAASAPEVGFACLNLDRIRGFLRDDWDVGHV